MEWILASGSPRRKELMHYITDDFIIRTSDADETLPEGIAPYEASAHLAGLKAAAVAAEHADALVIGCDTTVILDGKILGKPLDAADAKHMLQTLSGRTHEVVTGVALICKGKMHTFSETTRVTFYPLTDAEIDAYLATGEPFDKAGSYGIQGKGALFVKGIEGDYYNVVGLPIAALSRKLKEMRGEMNHE
ncbi:MAG: septum formation inhibitor Maf [Ruminococcus sp.]|nr:septum formation inhibitor Maf [Ruminococcus sp.]